MWSALSGEGSGKGIKLGAIIDHKVKSGTQ